VNPGFERIVDLAGQLLDPLADDGHQRARVMRIGSALSAPIWLASIIS
jgi:hypothetical protein